MNIKCLCALGIGDWEGGRGVWVYHQIQKVNKETLGIKL